jgi:hypothetical protein
MFRSVEIEYDLSPCFVVGRAYYQLRYASVLDSVNEQKRRFAEQTGCELEDLMLICGSDIYDTLKFGGEDDRVNI